MIRVSRWATPPQPDLGLHQGIARPGLQEARGILLIQLGLEAHLAQGRVQFHLLYFADVHSAIADGAANPETRVVIRREREGTHLGACLLLAVKELMTAATCPQLVEFDGTTQQGGEVPHLDLHAVEPDLAVDGGLLPELRLLLEQRSIDGIDLQGDGHTAIIGIQRLDLARFQSQVEDGGSPHRYHQPERHAASS